MSHARSAVEPRKPRATPGAQAHAQAYVLPLWPDQIADMSLEGRRLRVATLRSALRAERRRGIAGHWTYDLGRHAALARWYQREVSELAALERVSG